MKYLFAFVLLILPLVCYGQRKNNTSSQLSTTITVATLQAQIDSLEKVVNELKLDREYWFSDSERKELQEKGCRNAELDLYESLEADKALQNELQEDACLGGTMNLGPRMLLFGNHSFLISGSDGHLLVYYVIDYQVQEDKSIRWNIVNKIVD